jgi:ribosomal protein S18 acetylase RimI-like enzyme
VKIRRMMSKDCPDVARIASDVPLFLRYGMTYERALKTFRIAFKNPKAQVWVAEIRGKVAGFIYFVEEGGFLRSTYLRLIGVSSEFARAGIGKKLMNKMESIALRPNGIFLLVTRTNRPARAFYKRLGYKKVGVLKDYVLKGVDECIYFRGA